MDEEDAIEMSKVKKNSSARGGRTNDGSPRNTLSTSARATAKKREADELDLSDTEQSLDDSDDEDHAVAHPHGSKRSRTANKEVDPRSSLDFDIALPEEAMTDFNPVHDTSSSKTDHRTPLQRASVRPDTSDDRQPGEK